MDNVIIYDNAYIMFVLEESNQIRIVWRKHGLSNLYTLETVKLFSSLFFKIKSEYEKINFSDKKFGEIYVLFNDDFLQVGVNYVIFDDKKSPVIIINYRNGSMTFDSDINEIKGFVRGFNEIMRKPELFSGLVR